MSTCTPQIAESGKNLFTWYCHIKKKTSIDVWYEKNDDNIPGIK
jgi:hypothetical protein